MINIDISFLVRCYSDWRYVVVVRINKRSGLVELAEGP